MKKEFLEIGKITGIHGLRGEVRVQPWCDSPDFLCEFDTLYHADGTAIEIKAARVHKEMCILKLAGIDTAEAAEALRGTVLYMNRDDVELDENVFFIQDLIGLRVVHADTDEEYGTIKDVLQTGANDVYIVQNGEKQVLIPAIPDVVVRTDISSGVMEIRPLDGLFDI